MFKKRFRLTSVEWRPLPQRNEQLFSFSSNTLAYPNSVWFTPEVIISDAINIVVDIVLAWNLFKKALPSFSFRVAALVGLIFLVIGYQHEPSLAQTPAETAVAQPASLQVATAVVAREVPIYSWPVPRTYISTHFSYFHKGIDIPNGHRTPVHPFASGTVVFASWDGGFGQSVIVSHSRGYSSRYAHLSSINVAVGQNVARETVLGGVGRTGFATGSHLHLEIYKDGRAINPLGVLPR